MLLSEAKKVLKSAGYRMCKEIDPLENEDFIDGVHEYVSDQGYSYEACQWAVDNMGRLVPDEILNKGNVAEVANYMIDVIDNMSDEELEEEGII